jgi:hypothetical protein
MASGLLIMAPMKKTMRKLALQKETLRLVTGGAMVIVSAGLSPTIKPVVLSATACSDCCIAKLPQSLQVNCSLNGCNSQPGGPCV